MHLAYITAIILTLITNLTARVSSVKSASQLKALERLISGDDKEDMRKCLILFDLLEDYAAKRKYSSIVYFLLHFTKNGSFTKFHKMVSYNL